MVDTKKVSAKSAAKAPATPQSVATSAKPKVRAAKPGHQVKTSAHKEPVAAKAPVASTAPIAPTTPVSISEKVAPLAAVSAPVAAKVEPLAPPLNLVPAAPVEAIASSVAPKAAALRQAMGEAVTASANGALAVNDKVIEALQTQSHAALDLWRSSVSSPHLSDVFRLQSNGARQAYETASAQWKDIAETTAHWFTKTVEPLSSAISDLKR
jgi:hypothetical protein